MIGGEGGGENVPPDFDNGFKEKEERRGRREVCEVLRIALSVILRYSRGSYYGTIQEEKLKNLSMLI